MKNRAVSVSDPGTSDRRISFWHALALSLLLATGCAGSRRAEFDPPGRRPPGSFVPAQALVVGIAEYSRETDLDGPVNDARRMRKVLVERLGFDPDRVTLLLDEEATLMGLVSEVQRLVRETRPDETAFLYIAAHGSQVDDDDGDEEDGKDESILPYDAREEGVGDFTDDILGKLLAQADAPCVVILDTCHSGSGTRGERLRVVEDDPRGREFYAEFHRNLFREIGDRHGIQREVESQGEGYSGAFRDLEIQGNVLLLAATNEEKEAIERRIAGRMHGLFTWAVTEALLKNDPTMDVASLVSGPVTDELARLQSRLGLESLPRPQLEGRNVRKAQMLVPGSKRDRLHAAELELWEPRSSALPNEDASASPSDGTADGGVAVRFDASGFANAGVGSVFAVFPAEELDFDAGRTLSTVRVTERAGSFLRAVDTGGVSEDVLRGARAVPVLAPSSRPLSVHLADPLARTLQARLRSRGEGRIVFAGQGLETYEVRGSQSSKEQASKPTSFEVVVSDGMHIATASSVEDLAGFFVRLSRVRGLLSLENPSSALNLQLALETSPGQISDGTSRGLSVFLDVPRLEEHPPLAERELPQPTHKNSLMAALRTRGDAFVTLAHLDAAGRLETLFPMEANLAAEGGGEGFYDPRGRAPGGSWLRLPPRLDPYACWPLIGQPSGLANLWAFATDDEALATEVRAYLMEESSSSDVGFEQAAARLERVRTACVKAARERGADWDVALVNYLLGG